VIESEPTFLRIPREDLRKELDAQIERGREVLDSMSQRLETDVFESAEQKWVDFAQELLRRRFSTTEYFDEFRRCAGFGTTHEDATERRRVMRERMQIRVDKLDSIRARLELIEERPHHEQLKQPRRLGDESWESCLHPGMIPKCLQLYEDGHYGDAIERSFKIVRDRLRALTGYERGVEAFGRGNYTLRAHWRSMSTMISMRPLNS
jgi:hypothetical protein